MLDACLSQDEDLQSLREELTRQEFDRMTPEQKAHYVFTGFSQKISQLIEDGEYKRARILIAVMGLVVKKIKKDLGE
jgi:hypothetical protein